MTPGSHLTVLPVADFPGIELAACAGSNADLWFPERGDMASIRAAKAVCSGCEARQPCLEYALANHEIWGVWGGTTPRERRQTLHRRTRTP